MASLGSSQTQKPGAPQPERRKRVIRRKPKPAASRESTETSTVPTAVRLFEEVWDDVAKAWREQNPRPTA